MSDLPACAAVLLSALLAGCTVQKAPPREPERFERHVLTQENVAGNARSGIVEDRQTGCLYSFTYDHGVRPITLPSGNQAGCSATTASSVGTDDRNAGGSENQ